MASFLFGRTMKKEFLAFYKNTKSSKEFREFLHTLPEGVTIVDNITSEFKFVNSKFQQNLNCYEKGEEKMFVEMKIPIEKKVNGEIDKLMRNNSNTEIHLEKSKKDIETLLNDFRVLYQRDQDEKEEIKEHEFVRYQSVNNSVSVSLRLFLEQERTLLRRNKSLSRKKKVHIYWDVYGEWFNEEWFKKEFIVKTKKVNITDDLSENQDLFMHMFIDTTQISQLEEAKAQNRYQRQMLANVSHEFRTPLNAMSISLSLLKDSVKGSQRKFVNIANSSCTILSALVEDILDHAKIESGVFEIHETIFKFGDLFEEVENIFELQAKSMKIDLNFTIDVSLQDIEVKSDKQRLKQILLNLISNALKFTDKGFINISLKRQTLSLKKSAVLHSNVSNLDLSSSLSINEEYNQYDPIKSIEKYMFHSHCKKNTDCFFRNTDSLIQKEKLFLTNVPLVMIVEDSGIGISQKDQLNLFKLFGKLSSQNRNKTGWGLGLTICRKILQKLGGDIKLISKEGVGTKVKCQFIWKT
jgi:signal transduction histidine kinase